MRIVVFVVVGVIAVGAFVYFIPKEKGTADISNAVPEVSNQPIVPAQEVAPQPVIQPKLVVQPPQPIQPTPKPVVQPKSDISVLNIANALNEWRVKNNLPQFQVISQLQLAAEFKAKDMADRNYFAHTSPSGLTFFSFLNLTGYSPLFAGENISKGLNVVADIISLWEKSPNDKANLMDTRYTDIGVGIVGDIVVVGFGRSQILGN